MTTMTRMITVLLTLALCAALFTGCGGSSVDLKNAKSFADLNGAKIAAQSGTFHETALSQIDNVQASTYPEFSDLLTALKSGAIDGYIAEEPTALSVCGADSTLTYIPLVNNDTGFTATAADVGIAIGLKEGSTMRDEINAVLDTITASQRKELMEQIVAISAGQEIDAFILQSEAPANPTGTLKVGMECAYEPYNWTDMDGTTPGCVPISGEGKSGLYANGYDVQVAQYVANKLGLTLEIYSITWDSLLPALESGAIDAIIAGMSPTAEREAEIDFTQTYYESNLVVIIRR
jgi:ABC-type amino acid transport substrate-binding protein